MIRNYIVNNIGVYINTYETVCQNRIVFTYILVTNGKRYSAKEYNYSKLTEKEIEKEVDYLISTLAP